MKPYYVYQIVNKVSGKFYIGISCATVARKSAHFLALKKNNHKNPKLQASYNVHGKDAFEFSLLDGPVSKEEAARQEILLIYWFKELGISYNINNGGEFGRLGIKMSEETKQKLHPKRMAYKCSTETRAKISATTKGRAGKPMSQEIKDKLSKVKSGQRYPNRKSPSIESRINLSRRAGTFELFGESKSLYEWALDSRTPIGVGDLNTVCERIRARGWDAEKAILTLIRRK